MLKTEPNKVTAVLRVVATGEFYDDEASEETLRYCVEQGLEDAGFDVDVAILKEQEVVESIIMDHIVFGTSRKCSKCNGYLFPAGRYCPHCGRSVKWE